LEFSMPPGKRKRFSIQAPTKLDKGPPCEPDAVRGLRDPRACGRRQWRPLACRGLRGDSQNGTDDGRVDHLRSPANC
jgi:hypothetical protein